MTPLFILWVKIPQVLFYIIMIIFSKKFKTKNALLIILGVIIYSLLSIFFEYSVRLHVSYYVISFVVLKVLHPEQTDIFDILLFNYIIMLYTLIALLTKYFFGNIYLLNLFLLCTVIITKDVLPKLINLMKSNDVELRTCNSFIFNVGFVLSYRSLNWLKI